MLPRRKFMQATGIWVAGLASKSLTWAAEPAPAKAPQVEVVFCLDTTGSMGGLLEGAKQKIWSISNQIAGGKPAPDLKIGLVAYRDRGDAYVTQLFDLTDDLDAVHANLRGFQAQGGGDTPESVNQALHEGIHKMKWASDSDTLKILFLVGDAPPKMNYADDVKYPETCKLACEKGVIINTIQCGNQSETTKYWKEICTRAEGSYVQIAQDGGVQVVATPHDKRLSEINAQLAQSTVVYGEQRKQAEALDRAREAAALPPAAAADRAGYAGKANAGFAASDLLDAIKAGKVKLEDIPKEHLPPEMQKMTLEEQKKHLADLETKRAALRKEAVELDKQRGEYIAQKLKENGAKSGFDQQVLEVLRKQAAKHKITY